MFWSVGWPLLWAGGFFCNLDILYGGLEIRKLQFLIKKKFTFFSAVIFFQFLVLKALDPYWIRIRNPDPYWSPTSNSGSGSGKNEYGSTTLVLRAFTYIFAAFASTCTYHKTNFSFLCTFNSLHFGSEFESRIRIWIWIRNVIWIRIRIGKTFRILTNPDPAALTDLFLSMRKK